MKSLPEEIIEAWQNRDDVTVITTADKDGVGNSIYATCVRMYDNKYIVVADNYFDKTRKNILEGSSGVVLFITKDNKAYQIKGSFEYYRDGELYDFMKSWNPEKHPGHAAAVLIPERIYSGSRQVC